jgi:hypothetical protein
MYILPKSSHKAYFYMLKCFHLDPFNIHTFLSINYVLTVYFKWMRLCKYENIHIDNIVGICTYFIDL